jgi:methylisocitrate lyase
MTSVIAAQRGEQPLQVVGAVSAYTAMLAQRAGFRALYLSGSGVATSVLGLPDLGLTCMTEVAEQTRQITSACDLPLIVDADTGWGPALMVERATGQLERAGAAAIQLEDQSASKRCGHRSGKQLVSTAVMVERVEAAVNARSGPDFAVIARTDALAAEGLDGAIERASRYVEAGADWIFLEAATDLAQYASVRAAAGVPIMANLTEFGRTPLYDLSELGRAGVQVALYPLSAFRAMSRAAQLVYEAIRRDGTQRAVLDIMQTRTELYDVLDYDAYESAAGKHTAGEY